MSIDALSCRFVGRRPGVSVGLFGVWAEKVVKFSFGPSQFQPVCLATGWISSKAGFFMFFKKTSFPQTSMGS